MPSLFFSQVEKQYNLQPTEVVINRGVEFNFAFWMMSGPGALGAAKVSKQVLKGVKACDPECVPGQQWCVLRWRSLQVNGLWISRSK